MVAPTVVFVKWKKHSTHVELRQNESILEQKISVDASDAISVGNMVAVYSMIW